MLRSFVRCWDHGSRASGLQSSLRIVNNAPYNGCLTMNPSIRLWWLVAVIVAAQESCTLCRDGSDPAWPDRNGTNQLVFVPPGDLSGLCSDVALFAIDNPQYCQEIRFVAGMCGCPPAEEHCELCPEETLPDPDRELNFSETFGLPNLSCLDFKRYLAQYTRDSHPVWERRDLGVSATAATRLRTSTTSTRIRLPRRKRSCGCHAPVTS